MSAIPNELFAAILDELAHDYPSLKTCSLVATTFCSPSQRHLFRSIWLHRGDWQSSTFAQRSLRRGISMPSGTILGWHSLLVASPHLASYVRDLTIDLPSAEDEDITLKHVLRSLPCLERLVIYGMTVRWGELSLGLRSVILALLNQSTLERLHLLDIRDLPTVVLPRVLPSMRAFSIHRTTFKIDSDSAEITEILGPSRLEHLTISTNMRSTYKVILPHAPGLTTVTKMHLFIDFFSCMGPEKLLSALGGTLHHLQLDCDRLYYPLSLPPLPALRTLELSVSNGSKRCMPDGLAGTLACLPRVPLRLVFRVSDRAVEPAWEDEGTFPGLAKWQLDDLHCQLLFQTGITDDADAPAMRDVAFDAFRVAIRAAMPGMHVVFSRADESQSYVARLP
ncbi:hypothetical protein B0H11DRAFT_1995826 [Mycena galericulata]|nr:hypothetical protein B0H11DRAFT_1995826 [Mycena galericulata]